MILSVIVPSAVEGVHDSDTSFRLFFVPIGRFLSCDQNRRMAASATVRCGMGLTFRVSRLIPDCTSCPWRTLKNCDSNGANFQKSTPSKTFQTINRHMQTSIGERR